MVRPLFVQQEKAQRPEPVLAWCCQKKHELCSIFTFPSLQSLWLTTQWKGFAEHCSMTQMRTQPEQNCSYQDISNPNDSQRIRKRTGLIRSSAGMTLWSESWKQHTKAALTWFNSMPNPLEEDHNPSSLCTEAHLHSPRKTASCAVVHSLLW